MRITGRFSIRLISQEAPWTGDEPPLTSIRYTPVLTKQSALFNAWKLLCEIADNQGVSIRNTPLALMLSVNSENSSGIVSKKQDKKKKVDSMTLFSLVQ
jgi:hypothetical protein